MYSLFGWVLYDVIIVFNRLLCAACLWQPACEAPPRCPEVRRRQLFAGGLSSDPGELAAQHREASREPLEAGEPLELCAKKLKRESTALWTLSTAVSEESFPKEFSPDRSVKFGPHSAPVLLLETIF